MVFYIHAETCSLYLDVIHYQNNLTRVKSAPDGLIGRPTIQSYLCAETCKRWQVEALVQEKEKNRKPIPSDVPLELN